MSAGAIGGAITTGSLSGAIKGAVLGGLTAGFATRIVLHGGLSSFMSKAQGGRWSSGFWSGAVGTSLAPFAKTGNYYGNVASNAIIGGTVSSVTGGKFANGAVVGAFRYMFNDASHGVDRWKDRNLRENKFNILTTVGGGLQVMTGGFLISSGVGAPLGAWMVTLGSNNLYTGLTGYNPIQENLINPLVGEDAGKWVYLGVDLTSGGASMATKFDTIVDSAVFGKRVISTTVYQQTSTLGLGTEVAVAGNSVQGTVNQ